MNIFSTLSAQALPSFLVPFVTLSYQIPAPAQPDSFPSSSYYGIGWKDVCLMFTLVAVMALLRDAARLLVLEPFARWKLTRDWHQRRRLTEGGNATPQLIKTDADSAAVGRSLGSKKPSLEKIVATSPEARRIRHCVVRFAEQGWVWIYYLFMFSFGLYIYFNVPSDPWTGYPHIPLAAPIKLYYLLQMGFYFHAIFVINAEAPRKDHWQMNIHHVVTIVLMTLSYTYNFTRVGCLVLVIMDCCDISLPAAKMLRYLGYQTACDLATVVFVISWVYTRHFLFIRVIISAYIDIPKKIPYLWQPEHGFYVTADVIQGFVALLCALEAIQMVWGYMIFKVAAQVAMGQSADDSRSDDEGENEDIKKER